MEGLRPEHRSGKLSARILKSALAPLLMAVAMFAGGTSVFADTYLTNGHTGVSVDPNGVSVSANASSTDQTHGAPRRTSTLSCTYMHVDPASEALLGTGGPTPGHWAYPYCTGGGYINPMGVIWIYDGKTPTASPPALAMQAVSQLQLPAAVVDTSPAASSLTVNVPTWLWVDAAMWHGLTATASAGPVSATATATPYEVIWDMGDGSRITCHSPGTPWNVNVPADDPSGCSYTYGQSSASQPNGTYTITTTVYWHVTWTAEGAPGGGDLGLIPGPSTQTKVYVQEVHAINRDPSS
jgi:hypothetical protein